MSLWFRPPESTFSPAASRTMGFGQVPAARASFVNEDQGSPQETAAASGVTPSFGSRISIRNDIDNQWQFDGPNFNNISFGFNTEINNNVVQNYEINYVVGEVGGTGGGGGGTAFACTDLASCGGSGTVSAFTVLTAVSLGGGGLVFNRRTLNFNEYGLYTGMTDPGNTTISTVSCTT